MRKGDKVECMFHDSGHKFWCNELMPFVTISEIILTAKYKPNKLMFKEIPNHTFYENDFRKLQPIQDNTMKISRRSKICMYLSGAGLSIMAYMYFTGANIHSEAIWLVVVGVTMIIIIYDYIRRLYGKK